MILFYEDWFKDGQTRPDFTTKNKSFLHMSKVFKEIGIKNHTFFLALHDQRLVGVDPHDPNLTREQKVFVLQEVHSNPWYYLRECVRVPPKSGVKAIRFNATRGSISMFWLFFNNVMQLLIQPRQTGKTFGTATLFRGLMNFWTKNTEIDLLTKGPANRFDTVDLLKQIESYLPTYLQLTDKKDADNKEGITVRARFNKYKTHIGQSSVPAALNAARGLTASIFHIDEFAYINNIRLMLGPALAAGAAARANAKRDNMPYGTIFTTTSGRRHVDSGSFAFEIYSKGAEFTEHIYDIKDNEQLIKYVRKQSKGPSPIVICEFNHRQLGYTDEWLKTTLEESMSVGEDAEADFFNKWPEGSVKSPLDSKYIKFINESETGITYQGLSGDGYAIRWYVSEDIVRGSLKNRKMVIGADTSNAIGADDIALVFRDVATGEVLGVGQYNNLSTSHFGEWLASILIEYPNSTLIIENKSTGTTILDIIMTELLKNDIDPYSRLFSFYVQDMHLPNKRYDFLKQGLRRDRSIYSNFRKELGFVTTGSGRGARSSLYGETFLDAVKMTGGKVKDKRLVKQIISLREKNGRVDHGTGEHDDLVIAWLLSFWFLSKATNVKQYGMDSNLLLSNVINNSANVLEDLKIDDKKRKQILIKQEINTNLNKLDRFKHNPMILNKIITKVRQLNSLLDGRLSMSANIETRIEEIMKPKKVYRSDYRGFIPRMK